MVSLAISVFGVVGASFGFVRRHAITIICRIWLGALLGCVIMYLAFAAYLQNLESFLRISNDAHASIVLVLAGLASLVLVFVYSVTLAPVTDLALGREQEGALPRIGNREYRLYAALLRFLLVMAMVGLAAASAAFFRSLTVSQPPVG